MKSLKNLKDPAVPTYLLIYSVFIIQKLVSGVTNCLMPTFFAQFYLLDRAALLGCYF